MTAASLATYVPLELYWLQKYNQQDIESITFRLIAMFDHMAVIVDTVC